MSTTFVTRPRPSSLKRSGRWRDGRPSWCSPPVLIRPPWTRRTRPAAGLIVKDAPQDRVALGETNAEIAAAIYLSPHTVRAYLQSASHKLGAGSRVEALLRASEFGLL